MKKIVVLSSLVIGLIFTGKDEVFADDAMVLPKGRFRVRLVTTYSAIDTKYDASGDNFSLGSPFSRSIDGKFLSSIAKQSQLAESVKQFSQTNALAAQALMAEEIARLDTKIESQVIANTFALEYGLTERLCIGIILPVVHGEVEVDVNSTPNSDFQSQTAKLPDGHPLKALRTGFSTATTVNGLNTALKSQYNYSDGFKSWSGTGLGDLEVGIKYNYFDDPRLRMSVKTGARLPTGTEDDPNQIFDLAFGDGQYDLGIYNYIDYVAVPSVYFTSEIGYTYQIADSKEVRVPLSADLPIGSQTVSFDRKLGDYIEAGIQGNFSPIKRLTLSTKYRFKKKFKDSYSGTEGIDAALLEQNTDQTLHEGNYEVEYTNLPDVKAGRERIPYAVSLFYRLPYGGENTSDTRTTGLQLKTYF